MNIAVIFNKDLYEGGAFQYCLSILSLLEKKRAKQYNFIFFTTVKQNIEILKKYNINASYLRWSNIDEFFSHVLRLQLIRNAFRKLKIPIDVKLDKILKRHNVDLIYFLTPSSLSLATESFNYIFTVLDLCFRDSMEFPEVYAQREFERREKLYRSALCKAVRVITDSDFTKRSIIKKYNIDEERIACLPFLPSAAVNITQSEYEKNYIDMKNKYDIKEDYIFYPAQFWPHKNHVYILGGLKILKEKYNRKINAVFCGSDKGNLKFILNKAKELGIEEQIRCLGFVDDKEIPYLYKQSIALVMPTYFGPTNIPPLEAFKLNCPVLYSDLPGLREQVKGAAILLDLGDPESMSRSILRIITESSRINVFVENGRRIVESLTEEDYWLQLKNIFDDYSNKLKCWK
jgi:glycosyltransferase involved in cell wall biosynthesis